MSDIGLYIKENRTKLNISIRKLAKRANISHTEIYRIESGERQNLSPNILKAISSALNVPYDELLQIAGYIECKENNIQNLSNPLTLDISDLNDNEVAEVKNFIEFIRNRKTNNKK